MKSVGHHFSGGGPAHTLMRTEPSPRVVGRAVALYEPLETHGKHRKPIGAAGPTLTWRPTR